jgi:hypothetical protein
MDAALRGSSFMNGPDALVVDQACHRRLRVNTDVSVDGPSPGSVDRAPGIASPPLCHPSHTFRAAGRPLPRRPECQQSTPAARAAMPNGPAG